MAYSFFLQGVNQHPPFIVLSEAERTGDGAVNCVQGEFLGLIRRNAQK